MNTKREFNACGKRLRIAIGAVKRRGFTCFESSNVVLLKCASRVAAARGSEED